jgi:hypothetical protein
MSDNRAYTRYVGPDAAFGQSAGVETNLINQSSPAWVLTFVRWQYRDTLRISNSVTNGGNPNSPLLSQLKAVKETLVVRNDCINVSVTSSKASYTPSMEATLLQTNVDYLTEVAPGDFVFVNMLNWTQDAEDVALRADGGQTHINGVGDGFKGFFKVQSVRERLAVTNQQTGAVTRVVSITGYAFTEFNNMIYFNQAVALQNPGFLVYAGSILQKWSALIALKDPFSLRNLIMQLASAFIGVGSPDQATSSDQFQTTPNGTLFMPSAVGNLLGNSSVKTAADIYNFIFGLQSYNNVNPDFSFSEGFNPSGLTQQTDPTAFGVTTRFWFTPIDVAGSSILKPEYWDQVKVWDILSQYVNKPVNEFYSCFRVAPNADRIMPTVVFRQTPFSTEDFAVSNQGPNGSPKTTRFMTLPRWQISPAMVIAQDLGRDEAARVNYVQIFGKTGQNSEGTSYAAETSAINYVQDVNDIQRSGLRPIVVSGMFDLTTTETTEIFNSPFWAKLVGDALIGGHLKFSGTLQCVGISDPITVGDNVEYDGVVYHIEQVTHRAEINPESGRKIFRTSLSLSQGLSMRSNNNKNGGTIYPGMDHGNAYKEREIDFLNSQILPGVSESQDIPVREGSVDQKSPFDQPDTSFPQPAQIKLTKSVPPKPTRKK